ncbi:MAG: POTRA domain-containing protein, partial [Exilispira sp.]
MKNLKIKIIFLRYFILFYFFIIIFFYHSINIIAFEGQQKYKIVDIIIDGNKTISNLEIENFLNIKKEKIVFIDKLINLEEDLLNWGYFQSVKVNIEQISQNQINDNISINNDNENNILYDIIEIIIQIELYENLPVKHIRIKNENIYLSNIKSRMKLKENKADTITIAIAKFSNRITLNQRKKFNEWLQTRIKS